MASTPSTQVTNATAGPLTLPPRYGSGTVAASTSVTIADRSSNVYLFLGGNATVLGNWRLTEVAASGGDIVPTPNAGGGGGSQLPPRFWATDANTYLRWRYDNATVSSGIGPSALGPTTLASEGSNTLSLTAAQSSGSGNGIGLLDSNTFRGKTGVNVSATGITACYGYTGGSGQGAHPDPMSGITLWTLFDSINPRASDYCSYIEKAYFPTGNASPFISLGLQQSTTGPQEFVAYCCVGGTLFSLGCRYPTNSTNLALGQGTLSPDLKTLFILQYDPSTGNMAVGLNGIINGTLNIGVPGQPLDYGSDGAWQISGISQRVAAGHEPWDAQLGFGLESRLVPESEMRNWWQTARWGCVTP